MDETETSWRRIIIGTAGHIDHGKTQLVKALTGIDTDRLREEKERGISIELGFAFLDLGQGYTVSIVDVPGHERFIKHMVAGATGIDFVIMVVAADEGVMPQTREHLMICQLLGIKKGITVITKKDLVDEELLDLNMELTKEQFAGTFLDEAPVFTVSAHTMEGIPELKTYLKDVISSGQRGHDPLGIFRLNVDRVFTMKGFGTVVTGTTLGDKIGERVPIMVFPEKLITRARNIQVHGKQVELAYPGQRTAINLQNISVNQIERGDIISLPDYLKPTYIIDARFFYLKENRRNLKSRTRVRFHHGTAEVMGRLVILDRKELKPGESGYVQLRLEKPVVAIAEDRFIVRSYSPMRTIGGGIVLDPFAAKKKPDHPEYSTELDLLHRRNPRELLIWKLKKNHVNGISEPALAEFSRLYRLDWQETVTVLIQEKELIELEVRGEKLYLLTQSREELQQTILDHLERFHHQNPVKTGLPLSGFHSLYGGTLDKDFLRIILETLVAEGRLEWDKDNLKIKGKGIVLTKRQQEIWKNLESAYLESGNTPPLLSAIYESYGYDEKTVEPVLNAMRNADLLVLLPNRIVYHKMNLDRIIRGITLILKEKSRIDIAEIKNHFGLTRKYAIPVLEYTDQMRLTRRDGDSRVPGEHFKTYLAQQTNG